VQQRQKEALYEDFGSFLTKDGFYHTLDAYTEDNECLVVDTSPENHVSPNEMLSWFRAIDPGPFQMGSKEYWESAMNGGDDSETGARPNHLPSLPLVPPRSPQISLFLFLLQAPLYRYRPGGGMSSMASRAPSTTSGRG
jgi:hypothetical protein